MYISRLLPLAFIAGVLVNISACTAINKGVGGYLGLDTDLKLSFEVDADINPDERKKPSPLYLRMYELKSTKMFNKADFISLYERDSEVLGADLISVQKLKPLKPGESRDDSFVLDSKTTYIALYAEFLQYKDSVYRVIIPVVPNNVVSTTATVRISGNKLKVIEGGGFEDDDDDKTFEKAKSGAKKTKDTAEKGQGIAEQADDLFN
ncbi:MAG TPA: type VI secretion system lipoprotein TssJ [Gammaproteobacteria bacterium]